MTGPAPTASSALLERYDRALLGDFGTPRIVLAHGEGCYVWDADGARYLDLLAGIAVNVARPRPPGGRRGGQPAGRARLVHVSNLYFARAARSRWPSGCSRLAGAPPARRCSSPTPAPRRTRPRSSCPAGTGRTHVVAADGRLPRPHHGCARADRPSPPTASRSGRCRADVTPRAVRRRGRAAAAVTGDVAAVVLEPIQGEAGVIAAARRLPGGRPAS